MAEERVVARKEENEEASLNVFPAQLRGKVNAIFLQQISAPMQQLSERSVSELLQLLDKDSEREFEYARYSKKLDSKRDLRRDSLLFFCFLAGLAAIVSIVFLLGQESPKLIVYALSSVVSLLGVLGVKRYVEKRNIRHLMRSVAVHHTKSPS